MDIDNGATDKWGDDCSIYMIYPYWCGVDDDDGDASMPDGDADAATPAAAPPATGLAGAVEAGPAEDESAEAMREARLRRFNMRQ